MVRRSLSKPALWLLLLSLPAGALLLPQRTAVGQQDDAPSTAVTDLSELVGKKVDVQLATGKQVSGAEVTKVQAGGTAGSIKSITAKVTAAGRQQMYGAATIAEIYLDGQPLDVVYDRKTRELSHDAAKRSARLKKVEETKQRLGKLRHHIWEDLTTEQHAEWVTRHKEFLKEVDQKMPGVRLQLVETKYYLFYTDIAPNRVAGYIAYLDAMYEHLCKAFAIPEGKNIWCGKCVVVAFQDQQNFNQFETRVMNNPDPEAQGICHGDTAGKVIISIWKGEHEAFFAKVLVHETAHGFVHRYKSSVFIPSWVNEGIADWVAAAVVQADTSAQQRQRDAARRVQQTGSLGGTFFDDRNIDGWQYGVASSLVDMMLKLDTTKKHTLYKDFLDLMKDGWTPQESLQMTYGVTPEQLVAHYGRLVGVPNLQP